MLQLLERPAYQRAFGAGTAEQLMTIVTLGEMMRRFESSWVQSPTLVLLFVFNDQGCRARGPTYDIRSQ